MSQGAPALDTQTEAVSRSSPAAADFKVSERYRAYVLWLLFTVYVFNFADRSILTIVIQPIKEEFKFSDTEMGLLGGLAFAMLYCTLGIPIARRADQGNRVRIISLSLFIWSLFTVFTGLARSFTQLLLGRVAVGIGEAGCSPPAYSLLSDYFEPKRRSTALAIYSMGISGGVVVGLLLGGQVARAYGWRSAFYVCGLPGIVLALIVRLTLREPPRGFSEPHVQVAPQAPPLGEVLGKLWAKPSFRHLSLAAALQAFVGYGVGGFASAFLMRSHAMTVAQAGGALALITVLGGGLGTYLGGSVADRITNRFQDRRWQLWAPGIATLIAVPFALLVYTLPSKGAVLVLMVPALAIASMYFGPSFSITHSLVGARERALAGALLLFVINLIGLGMGPVVTGLLSDVFKNHLISQGVPELAASATGLRWAMCAMISVNVWASFHFVRAARTLREDSIA
jgi:MFS family permease